MVKDLVVSNPKGTVASRTWGSIGTTVDKLNGVDKLSGTVKPDTKTNPDMWSELESALLRVAAVQKARVIGNGTPEEIHVLADDSRPAKQIAKDVHEVVTDALDTKIDPRIVSVVQLEEDGERPRSPRPILDSVVVASKQQSGWVRLRLRLPDGEIVEGAAAATGTREGRAKAAVTALLQALERVLQDMGARVELEKVELYPAGNDGLVLIQVAYSDGTRRIPLSGTASVVDDAATAAARALLDALNRQFRFQVA